ncbi:MAG: hypothetical protein JST21_16205 [Bacteroidetes bacterium]|nr:hypothetical protein [Bacteroidota bacterium]
MRVFKNKRLAGACLLVIGLLPMSRFAYNKLANNWDMLAYMALVIDVNVGNADSPHSYV